MVEKYKIEINNKEERLYLYLNFNYEYGRIGKKERIKRLEDVIKDYLLENNIHYKGKIISLIVSGILIGNVILNNDYPRKNDISSTNYVTEKIVHKLIDSKILEKIEEKNNDEAENNKEEIKVNNQISYDNTFINADNNLNFQEKTIVEKKEEIDENDDFNEKLIEENEETVDKNIYIFLQKNNGEVQKIELDEYVVGVVAAEMPASFQLEALKAQAVIARTYALKKQSEGYNLKDNESHQSYKSVNELKKLWGNNFDIYYKKILDAVNNTQGEYLSFNGKYIEAVYHSTSNGKTESSMNVWGNYYPYLVSVESEYDNLNPSFTYINNYSYEELSSILGIELNLNTVISVNGKTAGDRIKSITINDKSFSGIEMRNLLGLRSADFDIDLYDNEIKITTRGYGHGVGLSQYGANGYAKKGYTYRDILYHYYPGVLIEKVK